MSVQNPTIRVQVETITPERARYVLDHCNDHNFRPLHEATAQAFADVMRAGNWEQNGETIKFDDTGTRLLDGQTRMRACALAGVPFTTLVVYGVESDKNIDSGRKRSPSQVFARQGEVNTSRLQGALSWLYRYEKGYMHRLGGYTIPSAEYYRLLSAHPGIRDSVQFTCNHTRAVGNPCCLAALHYLFAQKDPATAEYFIRRLGDGIGLHEDSPIYRLRERLITSRTGKSKLQPHTAAALIIIAWNYHRKGRPARALKWTTEGDKPTPFPEIE